MEKILTVFTPTFNRAYCLDKCYNSLVKNDILTCQFCKKDYPIYNGIPVPIADTELQNKIADGLKGQRHLKEIIKSKIPIPDERLWMPRAKYIIKKIYEKKNTSSVRWNFKRKTGKSKYWKSGC